CAITERVSSFPSVRGGRGKAVFDSASLLDFRREDGIGRWKILCSNACSNRRTDRKRIQRMGKSGIPLWKLSFKEWGRSFSVLFKMGRADEETVVGETEKN